MRSVKLLRTQMHGSTRMPFKRTACWTLMFKPIILIYCQRPLINWMVLNFWAFCINVTELNSIRISRAAIRNLRGALEPKTSRQLPALPKRLKLIIPKKSNGGVTGIMALKNNWLTVWKRTILILKLMVKWMQANCRMFWTFGLREFRMMPSLQIWTLMESRLPQGQHVRLVRLNHPMF